MAIIEKLSEEFNLPYEVIEEYANQTGYDLDRISESSEIPFVGKYGSEKDFAIEQVEEGMVGNLSNYLIMSNYDMERVAEEEADSRVYNMDEDEIIKKAGFYDNVHGEGGDESEIHDMLQIIDILENDIETLNDRYIDENITEGERDDIELEIKKLQSVVKENQDKIEEIKSNNTDRMTYEQAYTKGRRKLYDEYYDDVYSELRSDAVSYFTDSLGYTKESLVENSNFSLDYDDLARDLSDDYTFIYYKGYTYVFSNSYADGGTLGAGSFAEGGVNKTPSKKQMLDYLKMYFEYYDELRTIAVEEDNILTKKMLPTLDDELLEMAYDDAVYEIKADTEYAKGGNVPSIEKRVAEVNALIKEGNDKGLEVIDETNTWQAPMKYNPLKYSNGVLYISYKELDLYSYNKGRGTKWENKNYRVGKNEMAIRGTAQTQELTQIARMYRKALNHFNKYGYANGGYMADGGILEVGDKVMFKGNKYYISEITNKNVAGFIDTKWYLDSTEIGVRGLVLDSPKEITKIAYGGKMADGGLMSDKKKTTFDDKVSAIKKSLQEKEVPKKYEKEYGKTYDKKEALEAAKRIAGAMKKKDKMKKGGNTKTVENIDIVDFDSDGDMNVDEA
jgi:hypothetical protein